MDKQEYLGIVAILESVLAKIHMVHQEEAEYAKGTLVDIEREVTKAIAAYREKAHADRS